jgi:predicted small metal-binding protein
LNQLEEIIDLGTDDVNCQSLVLGGNFQAKHAQQKQEVAHFPNDYYAETAWNSRSVDEKLMQV